MSNNINQNNEDENRNIYLSKILLFTPNAQNIAEELSSLSESTVSTNCLNTIGMFPLIERIQTPLGTLCMSIWIISIDERFEQFRLGYYSGASHSIVLCNTEEELQTLSNLYSITPISIPTTILKRIPEDSNEAIDQEGIVLTEGLIEDNPGRTIFYRNISNTNDLKNIFNEIGQKISEEIISGEYRTFTPQLIRPRNIFKLYNKRSFEKVKELVEKLGYKLEENGIVHITRDDFTFEIDFYRNQVTAMINYCLECDRRCKHYRKLCVIEENQGYSNQIHFDNLRALAILYSLHDGEFLKLTGERKREDIKNQLRKLKELYYENCRFQLEENKYLREVQNRQKNR